MQRPGHAEHDGRQQPDWQQAADEIVSQVGEKALAEQLLPVSGPEFFQRRKEDDQQQQPDAQSDHIHSQGRQVLLQVFEGFHHGGVGQKKGAVWPPLYCLKQRSPKVGWHGFCAHAVLKAQARGHYHAHPTQANLVNYCAVSMFAKGISGILRRLLCSSCLRRFLEP